MGNIDGGEDCLEDAVPGHRVIRTLNKTSFWDPVPGGPCFKVWSIVSAFNFYHFYDFYHFYLEIVAKIKLKLETRNQP
jgi:hypothetical protein